VVVPAEDADLAPVFRAVCSAAARSVSWRRAWFCGARTQAWGRARVRRLVAVLTGPRTMAGGRKGHTISVALRRDTVA